MAEEPRNQSDEPARQERASSGDQSPEESQSAGSGSYVVSENDCMNSIAEQFGFSWERIWREGQNDGLKNERENPMVLRPGDRVTIPEKEQKQESGATEMKHRFRRLGLPAKVRLRFLDEGEPRANVPCRIRIDSDWNEDNTDDDGLLEIAIPPGATRGWVQVGEGEEAKCYDLELGRLEPHDNLRGVQQRLKNLGLYEGEPDGEPGPLTDEALSKFAALPEVSMDTDDRDAVYRRLRDEHGS